MTDWHNQYGYYDHGTGGGLSEAEIQVLIDASLEAENVSVDPITGIDASNTQDALEQFVLSLPYYKRVALPEPEDDGFSDGSINAKWTRGPVTKGTWTEANESLSWLQTSTGASDIDVWTQPHTAQVGDSVEAAFRFDTSGLVGVSLGFSSSASAGTQVSVDLHENGSSYRYMLNTHTSFANRTQDGTIADAYSVSNIAYVRVKYEAANTWGLYRSQDGELWNAVQSNYSRTMTPSHIFVGAAMITTPASGSEVKLEYFKINKI